MLVGTISSSCSCVLPLQCFVAHSKNLNGISNWAHRSVIATIMHDVYTVVTAKQEVSHEFAEHN